MTDKNKIINILPETVTREMLKLLSARGRTFSEITEIRLRAFGKSSFKIGTERIALCAFLKLSELEAVFSALCGGALYLHRDTVREGYISYADGVRVGVCGEARYEGCELVGVSNISSLVFRIPSVSRQEIEGLFDAWLEAERGMLIYSPPGGGKTTALKMLAARIGAGMKNEVVIIDSRREFSASEYKFSSVDILKGYKRDTGLDIAVRTLSPDVIIVDEIGRREEAQAMLESLNSGVKIIATAHAKELSELKRRRSLADFFSCEIFDVFAEISIKGGRRVANYERF